jgi:RNA polymerase sigma-70 factor (ECF subfamily)
VSRVVATKQPPVARFPRERLGDSELVEAVVRGDTAAVGVVWERYSEHVRGVLKGALGFDAAVEDLLQDVFVAFIKGASELRDPGALRAYLVSVGIRIVFGELRRRRVRRWVMLSPEGEVPESPQSPADVEGALALRALYRLLDELPARRRVVFALRQIEGLEVMEVAAALRISDSTVKREARKARETIVKRAERAEPLLWEYIRRLDGGGGG